MSSNDTRPTRGLSQGLQATWAALGLITTAPLMLAAGVAIRATSPGPIIFRQTRVGKNGEEFTLYKFRTMVTKQSNAPQVTKTGDSRITGIGKILRKFKVDELPQLWNVVNGTMALVGPRPEVPRYVDLGNPLWKSVLVVRPGFTDPVVINLRNEEELLAQIDGDPEEFYLDTLLKYKLLGHRDYIESRTAWSDLSILTKTVLCVVFPRLADLPTLQDVEETVDQKAAL